jgi:hypothetical protein
MSNSFDVQRYFSGKLPVRNKAAGSFHLTHLCEVADGYEVQQRLLMIAVQL